MYYGSPAPPVALDVKGALTMEEILERYGVPLVILGAAEIHAASEVKS